MISHLNYDELSHSLYLCTFSPFLEIYNYNFNDSAITTFKNNTLYDERNMALDSFSESKFTLEIKVGYLICI